MERITASEVKKVTNESLRNLMDEQGIPCIDIGEGPITKRHTDKAGNIIDVVEESGEKAESWAVTVSPEMQKRKEQEELDRNLDKLDVRKSHNYIPGFVI